ncbi:Mor transcription activator domain protein [Burkholderia sp. lig30]|jgi:hypothetical protein|uniref:Mor transcription activator family protein n=1 Tax=Burkholderia sp. lig30 TaxID=1192124 RepID=UPI000460C3A6|nr:Mor transcription activator family protein [Burkholderia sp. lig30]KDB09495.1 Mor transcription activator domain protein [Burkholderia sp. lig30]
MDLHEVEHLLPRTAKRIVAVIGLPAFIMLIMRIPGVVFPVPKRGNREGEARYEELAEHIGPDAASEMCRHFGGERIPIPTCSAAWRELRDRQLRAEFDKLTRESSALHAVSKIAIKHGITDRMVWSILKKTDDTVKSTDQIPLF